MTKLLFHNDSYLKEIDAVVTESFPGKIILDQTIFYPAGGGQPCDYGIISFNSSAHKIIDVKKEQGKVIHMLDDPSLIMPAGTKVHCILDWERRHKLMRNHTACHLFSTLVHNETGALITGNQLDVNSSRIDFSLEKFERTLMESLIEKANKLLKESHPVKVYWLQREQALKIPGIFKLAIELPETLKELRIVEIEGIDTQADGGTHVHNLLEVGQLELQKLENKGSRRRRIYFTLKEALDGTDKPQKI